MANSIPAELVINMDETLLQDVCDLYVIEWHVAFAGICGTSEQL